MPDLLVEIGTEELPPSAVASGEQQLAERTVAALADLRLAHGAVESFATPRRLAVLVRGVADRQAPAVEERRGPAAAQGLMPDGSFSPAAVGFARSVGVEPAALVRRQTPQGEYLFAVRELPGSPAPEVLPRALEGVLEGLSFPKTMRWDASRVRFPRPARWLVCLFGSQVLPVGFGELRAGRVSRGHRVFHPGPVEVPEAAAYEQVLRAAGVLARRGERREAVRGAVEDAAKSAGGRAVVHPRVLEEVTDLVERPAALVGRFDPAYLELPRDVLVVSMESHQRYFPVEDDQGALLPAFVVVTNGDPGRGGAIVAGNERVLRARLEDARFFFREDMKVPLSRRTEQLAGLVFHARLGTMRDKVLRVGALLGKVAKWMGLAEDEADVAFWAANVFKADLLTHLVYEFPELQGVVGREYALRDPELGAEAGPLVPRVAQAIFEHYLPRSAEDDLPATAAGAALGLADRLDTLVGYVGIGELPTGSEDPFALRRQALGFALVSLRWEARLPLAEAIGAAHQEYLRQGAGLAPLDEVLPALRRFLVDRTEAALRREGVAKLFIDAAAGAPWADLPDLAARARALQRVHEAGALHTLAVSHERCFNIARGGPWGEVDEAAFVHDAERDLFAQLQAVEEVAAERAARRDYVGALETLTPLAEVIDAFFDRDRGVLVMDPDERLRRNRLALAERAARVFGLVANFDPQVLPPALLERGEVEAPQR